MPTTQTPLAVVLVLPKEGHPRTMTSPHRASTVTSFGVLWTDSVGPHNLVAARIFDLARQKVAALSKVQGCTPEAAQQVDLHRGVDLF